ncbi:hypothetical protein AUEXF2481DRAFT_252778 [Aureobasidium subglaciale EXF-2481]|uniref:Uncharacterized protein n=1 Tax=Aureobasidium subglaciale (strain EXF-2481) TaxID=1043005 RepID=A0A074YA84_AURSE|nr:uncharacterized protein AUEXF2481DRAFT_252778 [Aureobasidium subglaciale EXF-2481]KAI5212422.1 hypothetical protein E4T38_00424 [Aureobasidium subglaciale]KAI5231597.1 hypothetical protein E4T40_00481 [Aureobasidium subglaciale]KAI5234448.1 hypothetical protein E4T41_00423 [Aureobasidium subglaciale]KAI5268064.1 hypothetical protein E4T46_00423 [Aureobasidium subglaciale]KEQ94683.1 hypothetical protein AUEXF2481DRAFT_252778 [Aureobasidium subglaciale EXF-2481]
MSKATTVHEESVRNVGSLFSSYILLCSQIMPDPPQKLALNCSLLEQLQARFPSDTPPSPSSPIAKGIAALERRASSRSAASHLNKPGSPFERSRTVSPLPPHVNLTIDTSSGIKSTASSPGPLTGSRRIPPSLIKSKMRPPSELFLPTPPTARSKGFRFSTTIPEDGLAIKSEPATPATTASIPFIPSPPLSPISASIADAISRVDVGTSVQNAIDNLSKPEANRFIFPPLRSSTAPPASLRRQPSFASIKSSRSLPLRALSTRLGRLSRAGGSRSRGAGVHSHSPKKRGSQFSGIDKDITADRRVSMMMAKHKSNLESVLASPIEEQLPARPVLKKATTSGMPWRKKARGETMSMLLDSGFFPIQEFIYEKNESPQLATRSPNKRNQLALNILVKDLPSDRPSSIVSTPTNFYHPGSMSLKRSTRNYQRRSLGVRQRILNAASISSSQISPTMVTHHTVAAPPLSPVTPTSPLTPTKALAALTAGMLLPPSPGSDESPKSGQPSPGILEVIPEDGHVTATVHSTPSPASHTSMRSIPEAPALPYAVASEIHLSSGTVLMVKTPESTAWRRSVYIQGLIKLPTPTVMPRKGSIATLEAFQDSLGSTPVPRRKSEDMAADDICDWYDTWAYDAVSFASDEFTLDETHLSTEWALSPLNEEPESPVDRTVRFPPPAPPLAKEFAAAMVSDRQESLAIKPRPRMSMPMVPLPESPKTPSIISSNKGHSRNSSGETSYKSAASDPIIRIDSRGSGMSTVSSVEEKSWLETDKNKDKDKGKRRESSSGEPLKAKPKMSRMRRFVQTASAIL